MKDGVRLDFVGPMRQGDRIMSRAPLLDETKANQVGTAYLECIVHRRLTDGTGLFVCNYLLDLQDGELVLQGLDPRGPGASQFAVTGGTGAYSNAQGEATFTDSSDPPETDMVIDVMP